MLGSILNEMIPNIPYIDNGYYSFLKSPKGYPMQLDRYYPRLHLAFEYNGKQHSIDSDYMFDSKDDFEYRKYCDKLKNKLCKELGITIIYIEYNEYISRELIVKKLIEADIYDNVCLKVNINL